MIGISLARCLCKWCRLGLHERWRFAIYARLARNVGSKYIEYRIQAKECSLIENYNNDDMVIRDPVALKGTDWSLMNRGVVKNEHLGGAGL